MTVDCSWSDGADAVIRIIREFGLTGTISFGIIIAAVLIWKFIDAWGKRR